MCAVEWKKLGDVCEIYDGTHQTPNYTDFGVKFVSVENIYDLYGSKKYISNEDFTTLYKVKPQKGDVLMTRIGDVGTCSIIDKDEPLAYYVSLSLLRPLKGEISGSYLKYIIGSRIGKIELRKKTLLTAVPIKINLGEIGKIILPIPSLAKQQEIVSQLDTFTTLISNLESELEMRRKQYEHYRNQLLDFEGVEGVEWKTLGEIAPYRKSRIEYSLLNIHNYISVENLLPMKGGKTDAEKIPLEGNAIKYELGDVLVGNIRPYLKKIWLAEYDGGTNGDVLVFGIKDKNKLNSKYLFYLLSSDSFFDYDNQHAKGGKMPRGDKSMIEKYLIPVPSPETQQAIVEKLDAFEQLIQSLETEIKLRKQQYEYYREKLLTFE